MLLYVAKSLSFIYWHLLLIHQQQ